MGIGNVVVQSKDGQLFSAGDGEHGQLGLGGYYPPGGSWVEILAGRRVCQGVDGDEVGSAAGKGG